MPTQKILCDLDVGGEVKGTSLDINGNADISGTLTSVTYQGDVIASAYLDSDTAHLSGAQTISGIKTFSGGLILDDGSGAAPIIKWRNGNDDEFSVFNNASGKLIFQQDSTTRLDISSSGLNVVDGITVAGNITANGNIVGDDGTNITNINSIESDTYAADADNTTKITMGATSIDCLVADTDIFQIGEDNFTFDAAVKTVIKKRKFAKTTNADANADGDIVYFGGTTSMDAGKIYYYNSSGNWALADADAESTAKGMLGVALGTASDTNGVLIRGMVTLDHDPGTVGDTLFLSTTQGTATATAPSGTGDIVRVVGYCLDSSNGQMYFNPDGTFVEVA